MTNILSKSERTKEKPVDRSYELMKLLSEGRQSEGNVEGQDESLYANM